MAALRYCTEMGVGNRYLMRQNPSQITQNCVKQEVTANPYHACLLPGSVGPIHTSTRSSPS